MSGEVPKVYTDKKVHRYRSEDLADPRNRTIQATCCGAMHLRETVANSVPTGDLICTGKKS